MYEKILALLDGSEQSEIILPYVEELSQQLEYEVNILGVCSLHQEHAFGHLLKKYLDDLANQLRGRGLQAKAVLLGSNTAEAIVNYANENHASLIAMLHSRSGLTGWTASTAEKVLRETATPLLLISEKQPRVTLTDKPKFQRILVPLDGSELGEAVLSQTKELARKTGAELLLLHVIIFDLKVTGGLSQASNFQKQLREALRTQAQDYMAGVSAKLEAEKLAHSYDVITGMPEISIIKYAKEKSVDLIAMSTHGRTGLGQFVLGSVADKVVHASDLPILIVRSHKK